MWFFFYRFSIFVHEEFKAEIMQEHKDSPENQKLLENIVAPGWKILNETPSPRFIKTHFPFSLLPKNLLEVGCKVG